MTPEQQKKELVDWLDGEYVSMGYAAGMVDPDDPDDVRRGEELRRERRIVQALLRLIEDVERWRETAIALTKDYDLPIELRAFVKEIRDYRYGGKEE